METGRYHHIFDISQATNLVDRGLIESFIKELSNTIDMNILHGPVSVEGIPDNPGVTAFAIVDFSHISIHTFTDDRQEALIDIFSCKEFDKDQALEVCKKYFATDDSEIRHKEVYWGN